MIWIFLEVPVIGQPVAPHGLHRDAIREAVAFVGASSIKIETCEKGLVILPYDAHSRIAEKLAHGFGCSVPKPGIRSEERQELGEDFLGCKNGRGREEIVKCAGIP